MHVLLTTQSVISELSDSKHVQTSDYTEHGDAGDVCQHLLHACGGQPLPVHDNQQGGPGVRLQLGGGQAEHEPGGVRLGLLKCQTLFEKAELIPGPPAPSLGFHGSQTYYQTAFVHVAPFLAFRTDYP